MTALTSRPLSERAMTIAEKSIPDLAAKSGHKAYKATLDKTGAVVLKTSQGLMVERRVDGSFTVIKHLPMGKRVKTGAVLKRAKQTTG